MDRLVLRIDHPSDNELATILRLVGEQTHDELRISTKRITLSDDTLINRETTIEVVRSPF